MLAALLVKNNQKFRIGVPVGRSGGEFVPILVRIADTYSFAGVNVGAEAGAVRVRLVNSYHVATVLQAAPARVSGSRATAKVVVQGGT